MSDATRPRHTADGIAPWPCPALDARRTNDCIRRLIAASGGYDEDIHAVVEELGLPLVTGILANEIAFRAAIPRNPVPLRVAISIVFRGRSERIVFAVVKDQPVRLDDTGAGELALHAEFEVAELLRQVFGPTRDRRAGSRATRFTPREDGRTDRMPAPEVLLHSWHANNIVLSACSASSPSLNDLADRYLTDKGGGLHWFTPHYEHHFAELRNHPVRLLEIGIGEFHLMPGVGGGSLKMWKRYFRRGLVYGIDIFDKSYLDQPRLQTLRGDQNDPDFLLSVAREYGPFDIIIDDGSHINEHVHNSFRTLFPHLKIGGLYVVEDLWTSFAPGYGGTDQKSAGPGTSIGLLKALADGIHYEENTDRTASCFTDDQVVGVHVYHNIAFVEKGINSEGGIPLWVDRNPTY